MKIKKKFKKNYKTFIKFIKNSNILFILLGGVPFILLDLVTRVLSKKVLFFDIGAFVPNFFTIIWVYIIVAVVLCFKNKWAKFLYTLFFLMMFSLFLVNNIYFSMSGTFFDFHLMGLVSEGSYYFWDAIVKANLWIYIIGIVIFIMFIYTYKHLPYKKNNHFNFLVFFLSIFVMAHAFAPLFLGEVNNELTWNTWRNPRNIYTNFNDSNKSFSVSGLYEYSVRNFYMTYLMPKKTDNETELEFLVNAFTDLKPSNKNKYTNKLKGKNVIFLQLEGIDDWLLKKDIMPNTYSLLNNSINFNNHYSYYNGGGSTFNSEFAVNTGYVTPITYTQNAYTFNKNNFPYSMPHLFKEAGYENINAFHMNTGEFYSRKINYNNWGYNNYYGLKDQGTYKDNAYELDRELINNLEFYDLMFKSEEPFVHYLITYSVHIPFNSERGVCKLILNTEEIDLPSSSVVYTEEDCIKIQAKETDDMVGLLIQALKDNNLYDNTVIVGFADHYLYTIEDSTILSKYKETENNLINKTPFFIWSKNLKKVNVNDVTSQLNILPTVLNLLGIEYQPAYYTGKDALAPKYEGLAIFSDYSWYDGKYYVEDGQVIKGSKKNPELIEEKNSYVDYIIKKNDLVLKYDYYKKFKELEYQDVK